MFKKMKEKALEKMTDKLLDKIAKNPDKVVMFKDIAMEEIKKAEEKTK